MTNDVALERNPCISPAINNFKISKYRVPRSKVVGSEFKSNLLLRLYRNRGDPHNGVSMGSELASGGQVAASDKRLTRLTVEKRR